MEVMMPQSVVDSMRDYYAKRAREYERIYEKPERQEELTLLKAMLPPLFADKEVLEIACGTGDWTQYIAPVAARVTAIDASRETMEIAAHRVAPSKVTFLQADAYALPRSLALANAAFAGFWFSHVPRQRWLEFIVNLSKHLRPGSHVLFLDNTHVPGSSHPITSVDESGNGFQTRMLDNGTTHQVLKNYPTEAELNALINAAGGLPIRFVTWKYYWMFEFQV
jgi:SAM-dependent methyltransferase